jgi:hypothetical protein
MLADAHELAQHERRFIRSALGDHKLHAGGVHPVPKWGDHSQVGRAQQGVEFIFLQCLVTITDLRLAMTFHIPTNVLVMNRDKIQTPILAVDMRDELADLSLKLRRVRQRRRRHLDHNRIPDPFRVVL